MESKSPPFRYESMESDVDGITGGAFGERDTQEPSSSVALFDNAIASLGGSEIALRLAPAQWHESDNYHVALVPRGNKPVWPGNNLQAHLGRQPVFVLPLTWRELVVRLRAGIGRSGPIGESNVVRFGEVSSDFASMEGKRSEEKVALTAMEFKLLRFLVQNAGRVLSRDEMLNEVWGYENYPCTRTVDNHILRLRQKLELDPAHPVHFHTVHGVGYKFVFEASPVVAERKM